ncbi:hypothetical protein QAD02_024137, partial [Eretmocerus hayati]
MEVYSSKNVDSNCYYKNGFIHTNEKEESVLEESEVAKFFDGLNILVTGGSGFLGKLLVEKLLRSTPKLGKLFMLMRAKKGKTPSERFKEHFDDPLYNRLKDERPDFLSQVKMIEGDTSLCDLGLSTEDREKLVANVDVVLHGAATVRFDETLRRAVEINVRGTKLILQFAKDMKNLKAFVYVSTAFSHCVLKHIEEKFYEPPLDPDKVISLVGLLDDDTLDFMTPKLIGKWPNTYAFSKALAEELVRVHGPGMPACVVRPSIMLATYREPQPGWINNFYGPTGVVMGAAIGLLRTLHAKHDVIADIIPADYVINNVIVAAWDTAKKWEEKQKISSEGSDELEKIDDPVIYNSVSSCQKPIDWGTFMKINETEGREIPSTLVLWHYMFTLNSNWYIHNLYVLFLHLLPAAIVDTLALLTGRKPILLKAYKKIHKFSGVISYFCMQQWKFSNENVLALWEKISPTDRKLFDFNLNSLDWNDYFYYHVRGLRVYILKDPMDTVERGRIKFH